MKADKSCDALSSSNMEHLLRAALMTANLEDFHDILKQAETHPEQFPYPYVHTLWIKFSNRQDFDKRS